MEVEENYIPVKILHWQNSGSYKNLKYMCCDYLLELKFCKIEKLESKWSI